MMKIGLVVIATLCLLSNQVLSSGDSKGEFPSLLKSVVQYGVSEPFKIIGPNGFCAYAHNYNELRVRPCGSVELAERYTLYDDGTLRVNGKCLTARAFTQGALVQPDTCNNPNRNATRWELSVGQGHQVVHWSSRLVLSVLNPVDWATMTLEANVYSWYQTFRFDLHRPVPKAQIHGMRDMCVQISNDRVWLGACGLSQSQIWYFYPDGTIRPILKQKSCLSFDNLKSATVLITACELAATSGRWVLTTNSTLLNEGSDLVLDVPESKPELERLMVFRPTGGDNQKFRISFLPS